MGMVSLLFGCALRITPAEAPLPRQELDIPSRVEEVNLTPVVLNVALRQPLPDDAQLVFDLLDDVSGLKYNIQRYPMTQINATQYNATVLLPEGFDIRYRYTSISTIDEAETTETTMTGGPVLFRAALVHEDLIIQDIIAGWPTAPYVGGAASLHGIVADSADDQPLADVLVTVAGYQTLTDMTGRFFFDNLPEGVHNLVAITVDGGHAAYQQQANLIAGLSTPAVIKLEALPEVRVTFTVTPPLDAVGAPIRFTGNFYQLGSTFTNMNEGSGAIASRMPLLTRNEDGTYSFQAILHAGTALRYKYTLGDGYTNAERDENGSLLVRRFIVPSKDFNMDDIITGWRADAAEPASIVVTVPPETPSTDSVSIQFLCKTWGQPIPMWPMGNNQWMYLLYGSAQVDEEVRFQVCRNDQCEIAYDETSHANPYLVDFASPTGNQQQVSSWHLWYPGEVASSFETSGNSNKLIGVEFISDFHPSYLNRYRDILPELRLQGVNWLIFTPTWTVSQANNLPYMDLDPNDTMLTADLSELVRIAREAGFSIGLYPQLVYQQGADSWQSESKSDTWWQQWYTEFERFQMNYIKFAAESSVDQYIMGGRDVTATLEDSVALEKTMDGVPIATADTWTDLIGRIGEYFQGELVWTLSADSSALTSYAFMHEVDAFYALFDAEGIDAYLYNQDSVSTYLESNLFAFYDIYDKPVYAGLNAPSLTTQSLAAAGSNLLISPYDTRYGPTNIDLASQTAFYSAYAPTIAQTSWLSGISTRGFFPIVKLTDFSSSIYGKPAMDVFRSSFQNIP